MQTIKNRCGNDPGIAIERLLDGLLKHDQIVDFQLDFNFNGSWQGGVCRGGAATVTLIQLLGIDFSPPNFDDDSDRANILTTHRQDLIDFEEAINMFRQGTLMPIERYFGLPVSSRSRMPWNLQNGDWENGVSQIVNFWERLTGKRYGQIAESLGDRWGNAALNVCEHGVERSAETTILSLNSRSLTPTALAEVCGS